MSADNKIDNLGDILERFKLFIYRLDSDWLSYQIKLVAAKLLWTSALWTLYTIIFNPESFMSKAAFFFALAILNMVKTILPSLSNLVKGSFFAEFSDNFLTKFIVCLIVANAGLIFACNHFVNQKCQKK